jgi:hypothetical protein
MEGLFQRYNCHYYSVIATILCMKMLATKILTPDQQL